MDPALLFGPIGSLTFSCLFFMFILFFAYSLFCFILFFSSNRLYLHIFSFGSQSNIGLILHAVGEYDLSLRFLEKSLKLNCKYYGGRSLKVAVSHHLVARTQSCMGDFRGALQNEKETYTIYKQQVKLLFNCQSFLAL